jgi:hypothetical protein
MLKEIFILISKMFIFHERLEKEKDCSKVPKIKGEMYEAILETLVKFYRKSIFLDRTVIKNLIFDYEKFDYEKLDKALDYIENLISKKVKRKEDLCYLVESGKIVHEAPENLRETLVAIIDSFRIFYNQFRDWFNFFQKIKQQNEENKEKIEEIKKSGKHEKIMPN